MFATLLLAYSLLRLPADSLAPTDSAKLLRPLTKIAYNLDFRNSFLDRQPVNVWGINAGIEFGQKRHQLTLGYYWLSYATYLRLINWRRDAAQRINLDYYTRTDMWFVSLLYWWNVTNNRRWMISVPAEIGGGIAYALPLDLRQNVQIDRTKRDFFVPIQAGAYAQWKATRWVGLSVQFGYRFSVFQTAINQNFNGAYYSFGVTVYPALFLDVWKAVTKKAHISPTHPPRFDTQ
ncbi:MULTISPECIES: hypothetical protein [Spirosoma]|uniref:DUF3575 domain-containing protein n=1 Tax=Spirosoma liriopis TaxID=2937440 RepID=A0ABT0HQV5_9BACT|nr:MULTISPECIES: hypothetical protein [Spirosoma]MCK8494365.1 hypothetical protein [Spirosoma liriopis]UHG89376.1 hypothetical protein LQ777_14090 [Spirosoma oryzicola]